MSTIKLKSTIHCPNCKYEETVTMPTNSCQYFYDCKQCKVLLKPKKGDCCVSCSYGDHSCHPIQKELNA